MHAYGRVLEQKLHVNGRVLEQKLHAYGRILKQKLHAYGRVLKHFLYICATKCHLINMFERTITKSLQRWRESDRRKPLVIRGARQTGKTTVVDQFGLGYANYLPFNLDLEEHRAIFEMNLPLENIIDALYLRLYKRKMPGDTLIFIDEIQNSPKAMSLLRYFKEKRNDLHVIAAGSLLENVVDVEASFPVGRVDYLAIRPCSFVEFAAAIGKGNLLEMTSNPALATAIHDELMVLFNDYAIVGGMPEAVEAYATTKDILSLDSIYESLLQGYKDDVQKYVRKNKLSEVVHFLIDQSWLAAGSIVTLTNFGGSNYRSREVGEAFRLLQKAMLLELIYPTTSVTVPAIQEQKRMPKLLMLDSGLVNYRAGIRKSLIGSSDILDVWRGRFAEQIVGQELLTLSDKTTAHRDFWVKGKDSAEVDFVFNFQSTLIPIEVKSGHNSHLRSLHSFMEKTPVDIAVRVWSQPFSVDEVCTPINGKRFKLINLPLYMMHNLEKILEVYS